MKHKRKALFPPVRRREEVIGMATDAIYNAIVNAVESRTWADSTMPLKELRNAAQDLANQAIRVEDGHKRHDAERKEAQSKPYLYSQVDITPHLDGKTYTFHVVGEDSFKLDNAIQKAEGIFESSYVEGEYHVDWSGENEVSEEEIETLALSINPNADLDELFQDLGHRGWVWLT